MTTKADLARFDMLHRIGCICCRKAGSGYRAPDVHHVLEGGRRVSHQWTLPLCPEHHRFPSTGAVVGPSLADGSRVFAAKWGTQIELLNEVNVLISEMRNGFSISSTAPQFLRTSCSAGDAVDRGDTVGGALFKGPA